MTAKVSPGRGKNQRSDPKIWRSAEDYVRHIHAGKAMSPSLKEGKALADKVLGERGRERDETAAG